MGGGRGGGRGKGRRGGRDREEEKKGVDTLQSFHLAYVSVIVPLSGMVSRAATALMADRFNSSCFSNSCLTELAFAFDCMVDLSGSISLSIPTHGREGMEGAGTRHHRSEGGGREGREGIGVGEGFNIRCSRAAGLK